MYCCRCRAKKSLDLPGCQVVPDLSVRPPNPLRADRLPLPNQTLQRTRPARAVLGKWWAVRAGLAAELGSFGQNAAKSTLNGIPHNFK
jgi:hypothetical protein